MREMTFDEQVTYLEAAILKRRGPWALHQQVGFTRTMMDVSLLKRHKVKKLVKDEKIVMGDETYTRKATTQKVWSLGLGFAGEWFYGNTMYECICKAAKSYSRWMPKEYNDRMLEEAVDILEAMEDRRANRCPECRQPIEHGDYAHGC